MLEFVAKYQAREESHNAEAVEFIHKKSIELEETFSKLLREMVQVVKIKSLKNYYKVKY